MAYFSRIFELIQIILYRIALNVFQKVYILSIGIKFLTLY